MGKTYSRLKHQLVSLPHCFDITRDYCSRFSGILEVDGKYLKVKPYDREIPVIYGVDYLTHDIPGYRLARSESFLACKRFFHSLKLANYPLIAVVCDDNRNIYEAAKYIYPKVIIQLCTNHFCHNAELILNARINTNYRPLIRELRDIFHHRRTLAEIEAKARKLYQTWNQDEKASGLLLDMAKKLNLLTGYRHYPNVPLTTNLIEGLNSHLEGRLKTIRQFQSFANADLWLNGYFIKRRLQPFTDCDRKFKRLNGTSSLNHTITNSEDLAKLKSKIR